MLAHVLLAIEDIPNLRTPGPRVLLTYSFHIYGDYFIDNRSINDDIGADKRKYYVVNFPYYEEIDDELSFEYIFKKTVANCVENYKIKRNNNLEYLTVLDENIIIQALK